MDRVRADNAADRVLADIHATQHDYVEPGKDDRTADFATLADIFDDAADIRWRNGK